MSNYPESTGPNDPEAPWTEEQPTDDELEEARYQKAFPGGVEEYE